MTITEKMLQYKIATMNHMVFGYDTDNKPKYGDAPMFILNHSGCGYSVAVTSEGSQGNYTGQNDVTPCGTKSEVYYWLLMWIDGYASHRDEKIHSY